MLTEAILTINPDGSVGVSLDEVATAGNTTSHGIGVGSLDVGGGAATIDGAGNADIGSLVIGNPGSVAGGAYLNVGSNSTGQFFVDESLNMFVQGNANIIGTTTSAAMIGDGGGLTGNASGLTVGNAINAANDGDGNNIAATYLSIAAGNTAVGNLLDYVAGTYMPLSGGVLENLTVADAGYSVSPYWLIAPDQIGGLIAGLMADYPPLAVPTIDFGMNMSQLAGLVGLGNFTGTLDPTQQGALMRIDCRGGTDAWSIFVSPANSGRNEIGGIAVDASGNFKFFQNIAAPNGLPSADPMDGTHTLWADPSTHIVYQGS